MQIRHALSFKDAAEEKNPLFLFGDYCYSSVINEGSGVL